MRAFVMAVLAAVALAGCASGQANRPAGPAATPSGSVHQARPVNAAPPRAPTTATRAQPTGPIAHPTSRPARSMEAVCPMAVPGTQVRAADTSDGASLVFTNSAGNVSQVRQRARSMAAMHGEHAGRLRAGPPGPGRSSPGEVTSRPGRVEAGPPGPGRIPPGTGMNRPGAMRGAHAALMGAQVREEDRPDGATLLFTPRDPSQLGALRAEVRDRAQRMRSGQCGMRGTAGVDRPAPHP